MRSIMYRTLALCLVALSTLIASTAMAAPTEKDAKPAADRSHIDLVIALDTSGSMDGLIDSARQKLWNIVNDLATAKPTPVLRVGLVSFGNDGYTDEGWTKVDLGLTTDLDLVYEKLMALRTNGGTEYVGRAIHVSHTGMNWSEEKRALKMIFVAGNESADQDQKFRAMSEAGKAIADDIIVNTIFCGQDSGEIASGWRNVAMRADGQFASIDQERDRVAISTPMDKRLAELSNELNGTYVHYGSRGVKAKKRQERMDVSARGLGGGAAATRAQAKASALYDNSSWDLVDGLENEAVDVKTLAAAELPPEMRSMNPRQREAYVKKMATKRDRIKKEIASLSKKRDAYIKAEMKKQNRDAQDGFDKAVRSTIRKQARSKGIAIK